MCVFSIISFRVIYTLHPFAMFDYFAMKTGGILQFFMGWL